MWKPGMMSKDISVQHDNNDNQAQLLFEIWIEDWTRFDDLFLAGQKYQSVIRFNLIGRIHDIRRTNIDIVYDIVDSLGNALANSDHIVHL